MSTVRQQWTTVGITMSIILAIAGQVLLSHRNLLGLIPYALAIAALLTVLRHEERIAAASLESVRDRPQALGKTPAERTPTIQRWYGRFVRFLLFSLALANALLAFLASSNNTFRWYGVLAWLMAVTLFTAVFWKRDGPGSVWRRISGVRSGVHLSWIALAVIAVLLIGFFFRFWRLDDMPSEMTSDHIEKLLDVHDLVTGTRPVFFVRNTGREPWQFYWTLMFVRLFELDTKFFALKMGTAVVGLITLPGIYLLGREMFGRWVGLWSMLFAAVASWPVILSRVGLRFPFAPAATAWTLLYMLRGLRDGRRNDFILLGLWLGIGLQGYTAFRAMPLAVVVCWMLAAVFRPASLAIRPAMLLRNALLTVLITAVVLIPLARFSLENPVDLWQRSFSRVADPSRTMAEGPILTYIENVVNLSLMFHWLGDNVWVNALVDAPVLDPVLGGLLILGLIVVAWRGLRLRDAVAPLLLVACALLLLPSTLSLAYPAENPSAVRTGGAIPALLVVAALPVGLALDSYTRSLSPGNLDQNSRSQGIVADGRLRALVVVAAVAIAAGVVTVNYRRYYVDYWNQYKLNALNTTEIASAIRGFIESGGDPENAWIVAWPYWIDTRGIGIELGDPPWNNVILESEELNEQADLLAQSDDPNAGRPRFYVLHPEDERALEQLRGLFPTGWTSLYAAEQPQRDFVLFYVPRRPEQSLIDGLKGATADAR